MTITLIKRKHVIGICFKDIPEKFIIATVDMYCQLQIIYAQIIYLMEYLCGKLKPRLFLAYSNLNIWNSIFKLVYSQSI